jgi:hypothetical protein
MLLPRLLIKLLSSCTALEFEAVWLSQQLWRVAILLMQGDPVGHAISITRTEISHEAPKTWRCTLMIYEPGAKPVAQTRRAWLWFALHVLRNRKWATPQRCSYHAKKQIFALQSNGKAIGGTSSGRDPKQFPFDRRAPGICLCPHCITLFHWKRTKDVNWFPELDKCSISIEKPGTKNMYYK